MTLSEKYRPRIYQDVTICQCACGHFKFPCSIPEFNNRIALMCPTCGRYTILRDTEAEALRAWFKNEIYWDGRNYRQKAHPRRIVSYNRELKDFGDTEDVHILSHHIFDNIPNEIETGALP